ncbi:MAG: hypothetical protein K8J08_22160, partial [Thermoanaerobaculia bacterium]|nr:hypothetical protein [Thermoanaerobaculia bacterium]
MEERERQLVGIEVADVALERHLLSDQRLVIWLPPGFEPAASDEATRFESPDQEGLFAFGHFETPPGSSLIQVAENLIEGLEDSEVLESVGSVRRLRIADRAAIEITGTAIVDGRRGPLRLAVVMDPEGGHHRTLLTHLELESAESIDALFVRLVRDWTPLDGGIWSRAFERRRQELVEPESGLDWDRRNRRLAEISLPAALDEANDPPEANDQANDSPPSGESPFEEWGARQWADGLLHHHPRVRMASLSGMDSFLIQEAAGRELLALSLADRDPAVRLRASRIARTAPSFAAEILGRVLLVGDTAARAGALQYLVTLAPPDSESALLQAFSRRGDYSPECRRFLTTLLARWGQGESRATTMKALWQAWRFSQDESDRSAFLVALLDLGHPEALALARRELSQPSPDAPLDLEVLASALAVHSQPDDLDWLQPLEERLGREHSELEGEDSKESHDPAASEAASEEASEEGDTFDRSSFVESLVDYLEALRSLETPLGECELLLGRYEPGTWIAERSRNLGCEPSQHADLLRITVQRPGPFVESLLQYLQRLDLGQAAADQTFHVVLDQFSDRLQHWAGDPVSVASTGADLSAPLEFT